MVNSGVQSGWAALGAGEWLSARRVFERALATRESAEAWEGLSWAAWWLDDAEVVFSARERAYRAYRRRGDACAAARLATWLAADELDFHGAPAVANGWLRRAHRLLDGLEPTPDHGWLAFHEGYIAHAGGDPDVASARAVFAAETGRRFGVPDLEMLGLALEGASLVACADVADGMRRLDEATAAALEGEATIPISGAWACCFLVTACTAVLDFERAFEWCDRIAAFAERYGSRYMLAFCRAEYGVVDLWRGRWPEAERALGQAVADFSRSRPAWTSAPQVGLAELRRRQGRPAEATQLLDVVGKTSGADLCRARMALDRGDVAHAVELLERLLRRAPKARRLGLLPILELLVHAHAASGELDRAESSLAALREIETVVRTVPVTACVERAAGALATARGDHDSARQLLEDSADRFRECGAPYEEAVTRVALAGSLLAAGSSRAALREAAAAREVLAELGAAGDADRARRLMAECERPAVVDLPLPELTTRERQVLALLVEGLTNRQIAQRLVVSEHTVHRHVTNILRKLGLQSRTAAAARAVEAGMHAPRRA